jgi:heme-degrading monooxygenase HmoA
LDELPTSSWASAGLCGLRNPREDVEDTHGMSFVSVFAYEVEPEGRAAFEAVYGPDGEWARFFRDGDGYLGTELLRRDGSYLLLDRWRSEAAYDAFLAAAGDEYARRNEAAKRLWRVEQVIGRFESV